VKQLEDDYVHFIALSFFFLLAKFCAYWCRHVKVIVNNKWNFFETRSIAIK